MTEHLQDHNYHKFFHDCQNNTLKFPYVFDGYDERVIEFWHSDENRPFLRVSVDKLVIEEDLFVQIYSRDYDHPIAVVEEYDYWTIEL